MRQICGFLAALMVAQLVTLPVRADPVTPPLGCTAIATLVYENCGVSLVSICEDTPPGHRLYEFYRDGTFSSRSLREDGVFAIVAASETSHREFRFESGLMGRLLALGKGGELVLPFEVETRTAEEAVTLKGVMRAWHQGTEEYPLPDGPVEVVRITVEGIDEAGKGSFGDRLIDLEMGVMLVLEVAATYPDRVPKLFEYRTAQRLLPGEPGFADPEALSQEGCGEES